jgi:sulfhydrogenase subunit beta (sulfur reductase)
VLKKTAIDKISELASRMMEQGTLIAPVKEDGYFHFREIADVQAVDLNYHNTVTSPKSVFFPPAEDFIHYETGKSILDSVAVELNVKPTFLFGVRPCDVRSFQIMDIHFSGTGSVDPYWQKRREATVIFGYAFYLDEPAQAEEFYSTLGIGAADPEGSDIFMIRKENDLLLKSMTSKGEKILDRLSVHDAATPEDEKYFEEYIHRGRQTRTRFTCIEKSNIAKKLEDLFHNNDFWMKISSACLSCGVCTFLCPNCYCFDICDETLFGKGTRRRVWDACMFTDFTLEASGHNPRMQVYQRLRQKINHKYSYHVRKYDTISCVGCGRCTRHCPVNIDIFSIVEDAMKA